MTVYESEKYLRRIRRLDVEIDNRWEDLQRLDAMRTKVTTVFSMAPVAGSGNDSKIEDMTIKIISLTKELNQKIDEFVDLRLEAAALIERLNNVQHIEILRGLFFEYKSIDDLAKEMHKSTKTIRNRRKDALKEVDALLEDRKEAGVENA